MNEIKNANKDLENVNASEKPVAASWWSKLDEACKAAGKAAPKDREASPTFLEVGKEYYIERMDIVHTSEGTPFVAFILSDGVTVAVSSFFDAPKSLASWETSGELPCTAMGQASPVEVRTAGGWRDKDVYRSSAAKLSEFIDGEAVDLVGRSVRYLGKVGRTYRAKSVPDFQAGKYQIGDTRPMLKAIWSVR